MEWTEQDIDDMNEWRGSKEAEVFLKALTALYLLEKQRVDNMSAEDITDLARKKAELAGMLKFLRGVDDLMSPKKGCVIQWIKEETNKSWFPSKPVA